MRKKKYVPNLCIFLLCSSFPFQKLRHISSTKPCLFVSLKVRSAALNIIKWMYEKDHLRDYIEKFALNYMQLLVHPNPPSLLFGVGEDTGLKKLQNI